MAEHVDGSTPPDPLPSEPAHRAATPRDADGKVARHRRRVTTNPPPGSDPAPAPEPPRHVVAENDERLRRDKPPHWS